MMLAQWYIPILMISSIFVISHSSIKKRFPISAFDLLFYVLVVSIESFVLIQCVITSDIIIHFHRIV